MTMLTVWIASDNCDFGYQNSTGSNIVSFIQAPEKNNQVDSDKRFSNDDLETEVISHAESVLYVVKHSKFLLTFMIMFIFMKC